MGVRRGEMVRDGDMGDYRSMSEAQYADMYEAQSGYLRHPDMNGGLGPGQGGGHMMQPRASGLSHPHMHGVPRGHMGGVWWGMLMRVRSCSRTSEVGCEGAV